MNGRRKRHNDQQNDNVNRIPSPILTAGIGLLLVAGCAQRNLQLPTKAGPFVFDSSTLGNKESFKEATFVGADGSSFTLKGFSADQVEALGIVAESAARGAVQAFTGGAVSGTPGAAPGSAIPARSRSVGTSGLPAVVSGPDGRSYKLLVRNGVVLLDPVDSRQESEVFQP